jgi:hypothetical protein
MNTYKTNFLLKYSSADHIDSILDDKNKNIRIAAIRKPYATSAHIDKAINDPHKDVRETAININTNK